MKNLCSILLIVFIPLLFSCSESTQNKEGNEESLEVQGEETGGMGTGPGPGVQVPLDTAGNIQPDTVVID